MRLVRPSNSWPHMTQLPLTLRLRAATSLATWRIASRKCSRKSPGNTILPPHYQASLHDVNLTSYWSRLWLETEGIQKFHQNSPP